MTNEAVEFARFVSKVTRDAEEVLGGNAVLGLDTEPGMLSYLYEKWTQGMTVEEAVDFVLGEDGDVEDGQPDWAKEWEDFGEVYSDEYNVL